MIQPVDPGIKFVILMHPWEAYKQRTGTGRLTSLCLEGSEIIIDKTFDQNRRFKKLIDSPNYFPMVLYPGKEAFTAAGFDFENTLKGRRLLVFLIDATWVMARKMMYRSSVLQALPRISFERAYTSRFIIKTQPADYCLSTIESTYYLIKELQECGIGIPHVSVEGLMLVFDELNRFQMECRDHRFLENVQKKGKF
ncbi:DTW domain-containing protein [Oceanispirochaeta crateris]|uniref:tRNA-uridine aminocarboxypropyltransferase n=2 Tax=Oceanispirochaeta crateris TaxID=2518645 RepID=A0A5C1QSG6_9SPIO|nr:DTW domain-containing protein [Oceanispirochaeta crateris]